MMEPKIRFSSNNKSWEKKNIGDIFFFKNGLNKDKSAFGHGTPIINYTDVYRHRGLTKDLIKGKVNLEADEIRRYKVKQGDVFFTRTSETPEEVGFSSVMLDEVEDCSFSGFVLRARPMTDDLLYEYCKECFSTGSVRKYIILTCTYTTRALTNGTVLSRIPIYIPQKSEQQTIASYFTSLDSQISAATSRLASLKQMKAASLLAMFPQEGETVPKVRFKGFEGEWKKVKADSIFKTFNEKNRPDLPVLSATQDRGMVTRESIGYNIFHDTSNEATYKHILPGQFVIHLRSFQGGFAHSEIEGIASPAYTIMDFKDKDLYHDYYWRYVFMSKEFIKRLELIAYGIRDGRSISYDEFKEMSFLVPSKEEQIKIASYLKNLDHQITLQTQRLEKLKQIKSACLDKMFV